MQEAWTLHRAGTAEVAEDDHLLDALAQRAAKGDRTAFERIYTLLVDDLFAYVRSHCRDDSVAEDLLANVFLKAWRSARRYREGSGQFRRWIFTIARNEVRDHWRAERRTLPLLDASLLDEAPADTPVDPEEVRRIVRYAMSVLTEEQRTVVALRYFNNKTHDEIAQIMGKREGAIRALQLRALRRMRKAVSSAAS